MSNNTALNAVYKFTKKQISKECVGHCATGCACENGGYCTCGPECSCPCPKIASVSSYGAPKFPLSDIAKRALFRFSSMRYAKGLEDWTEKSKRKFWESVGETMTKCMKKVKDDMPDVGDPAAFCNKIKSEIGAD